MCDTTLTYASVSSGAVVGPRSFGAFQTRGFPIANRLNWPAVDASLQVDFATKLDTILAVKCMPSESFNRNSARLVADILDLWWDDPSQFWCRPSDYWKKVSQSSFVDEWIATSPVMADSIKQALPGSQVWYVPHASDPRIESGWYDPSGPICYSGNLAFVDRYKSTIEQACRWIGKEIIWNHDHDSWKSLEGASLALTVRLPPYSTRLNNIAKPQVKVANAAAAGIPVLCTSAEIATTSIWPDLLDVAAPLDAFGSAKSLVPWLEKALSHSPPKTTITHEDWLATMEKIIKT